MKLLLDTSALIRWHAGTMKATGIRAVQHADVVAVSAVSAWEISIKRALGKLEFNEAVEAVAHRYGFLALPVTLRHADLLLDLPPHHGDPFDRLLIVQALEEGMTIVTSDRVFDAYRVPVTWI